MKKNRNLIRDAIEGKRVVYLIVAGLILVGFLGIWKMNKDEFPTVEIKQGLVAGVYPGASAEEVEQRLTKPLEQVLLSCPEVDRSKLKSVSKDGMCYIYVTLDVEGAKMRQTWADIRFKFQTAKLLMPVNVLAIVVLDDFSSISSLLISMESEDKGWSEMSEYANDLKERLMALENVAKVGIIGEQSEEIAVEADVDKLVALGVSPSMLELSYRTDALHLPAGTFKTDDAESRIYISQQINSEEAVAKQIVSRDAKGGVIRLEDVATIERRVKEKSSTIKFNGHNTLLMSVSMRPDNDIVAFGSQVDKVLKTFEDELPDSVHLTRVTDQPKVVKTSIVNFVRDLIISILVVILVMMVLFPFNSAIVASTGVPVCTAVAIAIMFVAGMPLNTVTLAGLIVVLGMIVDDSIVTMDGYMDKLRSGFDRVGAAVQSGKELVMPMLMATLSISLMLFPMLFILPGHLKDVFGMFPWVLAIALMTSLAYAVFVIPSLEVKFIGGADPNAKKSKFALAQEKFFNALQNLYEKGERLCFKAPKTTLIGAVLIVGLGIFIFTKLNIQLLPKASRDMFVVEINLDETAKLSDTQEVADSLTHMLLADPRVKNVTSFSGVSAPRFHATYAPTLPQKNFAQLIVNTTSEKSTEQLLVECEDKYEFYFTNALVRIKQMDYQGVNSPVEYRFNGKDRALLMPYADSLEAFMKAQTDVMKWVHRDYAWVPSVNVTLDNDEATMHGVNPALLSLSLGQEFGSSSLISMSTGGSENKYIPVNLYSIHSVDSTSYDAIRNKMINGKASPLSTPLRQVASVQPEWVLDQLIRTSGVNETVSVCADVRTGKSFPEAQKRIDTWMKEHMNDLPDGVQVKAAGLASLNGEYAGPIAASFIAALLVMFVFLMLHFKKVSIATLTMTLSLLCLFGSFFGLLVFKQDFSMTAVLGLVSLIGIIVRNGIIMFEYAEELHFEEGLSYKEAAMLAGARRMRPIFLTSCTAALGVLPMIISGDALWMPMGVVICFGVMLTLPIVVLVMPISYWQLFAKRDLKDEKEN